MKAALAFLDMTPIFAVYETETWMALSTSKDPETELRMFKTRNARVQGFAFVLYADNEVYARRVVARALDALELYGVRRDGRWVGATAERVQAALFEVGKNLGAPVVTSGERLQRALLKVDAKARLAGRAGG